MSGLKATADFQRSLSRALFLITLGFIAALCAFKLLDPDFWWHIKAGEIMLRTHSLISIEPFAYTRAGLPYIARHEWLAQIALFLVYHLTGATGVILFRTLMVALTFSLLLGIDWKSVWPNGFLVIWAANVARPGFTERPQLFTFAIFAAFLWLAYRFVELDESPLSEPVLRDREKKLIFTFVVLEVLWVNFHGGACLIGLVVAGALLGDRAYEAWSRGWRPRSPAWPFGLRCATVLLPALFLASFLSPNTYHNLTYTFHLFTDKTATLIGEWEARPLNVYGPKLGPFWVLAIGSLFLSRKGRVFSGLVLAATGFLSLRAMRHEVIFVLTALGVIFFSLKHSSFAQRIRGSFSSRKSLAITFSAIVLVFLFAYSREEYIDAAQSNQLFSWGYGVFEPARGAADFLEREHIQGALFNTLGIGGYLLYRGFPVYIDGRNVDYGYDFLLKTVQAGKDPVLWKQLEETYHFTAAAIDYKFAHAKDFIAYGDPLDANPHWKLVYLDDWVAVYLKDIFPNLPAIRQYQYRVLTPHALQDPQWVRTVRPEQGPLLEAELRRVIEDRPDAVKGRLTLARYFIQRAQWEKARSLAEEALRWEPLRPDVYDVLESIEEGEGRWKQAAAWYERAQNLFGPSYNVADEMRIGHIFLQAGDPAAAREHWQRARKDLEATLSQHPDNAVTLNNLGVLCQEAGDKAEATSYFQKAVIQDPNYVRGYRNLGITLYESGRYTEAWECVLAIHRLGQNPEPLASAVRAKLSVRRTH